MSTADVAALALSFLRAGWRWTESYVRANPWAAAVAAYGAARALGVVVRSGRRGVLFRWGRVVKELEPGFHWIVPVMHGVRQTPVRSVSIHLPGQKVMTSDGLAYEVGANVVYRVVDATKALTLVDDVDKGLRAAIPIVVAGVIVVRDQSGLLDRADLDRLLSEGIHAWVARWGLEVEQAGFTTIRPHPIVLRTTQLRPRTNERASVIKTFLAAGLDPSTALALVGVDRTFVAATTVRYRRRAPRAVKPASPTKKVIGVKPPAV